MRIVLTGANGQLGKTLAASGLKEQHRLHALGREDLDITSSDSVSAVLDEIEPDLIINAAAYTGVDAAQSHGKEAFAINEQGVEYLSKWSRESGSRLIHLSTDFVFNGKKNRPYKVDDETSPINVYGDSKLAGEKEISVLLPESSTIVRTAWLYSPHNSNFVLTMLRLMQEKDELNVVDDQLGTPCSTASLAAFIIAVANSEAPGRLYHWTDAGVASWYDFAVAIQEEALSLGLLDRQIPVRPIATQLYPTPARRPAYSVLDKSRALQDFDVPHRHWRVELRAVLQAISEQSPRHPRESGDKSSTQPLNQDRT